MSTITGRRGVRRDRRCHTDPDLREVEADLAELEPHEAAEYLTDMGLAEPGLNALIREAYRLLGLQSYFTAGEKEVRAWTVPIGAKAPQAAGVIHTDFERGFIKAEVIGFEEFVTLGGEKGAKEAGKMRLEGKEYVVQTATSCISSSTCEPTRNAHTPVASSPRSRVGCTCRPD